MRRRFNIVLLAVGFLLMVATESETGASNVLGLGMTAFSGWKLGLFGN
ncbi:hypothetical protein [uncultured Phocaeicola sp.]|nr:hypothetical protein [uncultured Phocaeicola sp.]